MRFSTNHLGWICVLATVPVLIATTAHAQPCTFSVDIHAVDDKSHEPVNGAFVRIADVDSGATDDNGHLVVRGLCSGAQRIQVERADYLLGETTLDPSATNNVELELAALPTETIEVFSKAPDDHGMVSTTTLSGDTLARSSGRSFAEVIAEVPGVAVLGSASEMGKPMVRGQYGRRLLLLVDGIRHRAQEWGLDHAPEIDPFVASNVTVVRGASGVRFGPDAIGGAVLVETPALLVEPGYAGQIRLTGNTNGFGGTAASRLQVASATVPGLAGQIEGSFKRTAASETPDYALDNTGVSAWNLGGAAGYSAGRGTLTLSYFRYQATLGVCSCLKIDSRDDFLAQLDRERPLGSEFYLSEASIDRPKQQVAHDRAIAAATWDVEDKGLLRATYAFQYDHRREFDVVRQATVGPQFNFRLATHDLELGFEHRPLHLTNHWHLRGSTGLVGMAQVHEYSGLPLVPDHVAGAAGAYVLERLIGHDLEFEGGFRYDILSRRADIDRLDFLRLVRSDQIASDACGDDSGEQVHCHSSFHTLSASLGALVHLTDKWSAKLDLSTASRPPNPDEQYLNGTAPTSPVLGLGKPDLGPETTYSATVTSNYQGSHVAAEASAYVNRINDYIEFAPALDDNGEPIFDVLIRGAFPRFVTRPVDAVFYGVDGGVTWRPVGPLELAASVSAVRAQNRTTDGYLSFVPADRLTGSATYKRPSLWGVRDAYATASTTVVAQQNRTDSVIELAPPPPGYALWGAEVGATLTTGDDRVVVSLQAINLTDERYRDYTSLLRYFADQPGRQLMLRLRIDFASKP